MLDPTAISAALGSVKAIFELLKSAKDGQLAMKISNEVANVQGRLLDVQQQALALQNEMTASSQPVAAPVQVSVNGSATQALYAGSYPDAIDGYQVNFQLPQSTAAGTATLALTAGFIAGDSVKIPVQ